MSRKRKNKLCFGYHFTSWENYQFILEEGLRPQSVRRRCLFELPEMRPYLENGAIWLYKNRLADPHILFGVLVYCALNHDAECIVRLCVEYDVHETAFWLATHNTLWPVVRTPTHLLKGCGQFGHAAEPFELVVSRIPPGRIWIDGKWNLPQLVSDQRDTGIHLRPFENRLLPSPDFTPAA